MVILSGCSKNQTPEPNSIEFDKFVNKILGYHIIGQEDKWGDQNVALLNLYEDALVFSDTDSLNVAFIGFSYGYDDLSQYHVTRSNYASWKINKNNLTINLPDGKSEAWKILKTDGESVIFEQMSNNEIFSMKIMD